MKDRTPTPRDQRPALPTFTPVPRKCARHDGWTPERQVAFIEALADTGSVETAARTVNMSTEGAYALRRHAQADQFRAAWDAALACGWRRLKDEAFERAMNGQLVPVFVAGKLMGYRRKKNDRLLMFILSHYGPDGPQAGVRPLTVNVINASATAVAAAPEQTAASTLIQASTAPATLAAPPAQAALPAPDPAAAVAAFAGVPLDDEAQEQIVAALTACAARRRTLAPEDDPAEPFIHADDAPSTFLGELESGSTVEDSRSMKPDEVNWRLLDDEAMLDQIDRARQALAANPPAKALPAPEPQPTPAPAAATPPPLADDRPQPDRDSPAAIARRAKQARREEARRKEQDDVTAALGREIAKVQREIAARSAQPPSSEKPAPQATRKPRRRKPATLPAPPARAEGERYSDSMPWLSEADRQGADHIDAMIEVAKAKGRGSR